MCQLILCVQFLSIQSSKIHDFKTNLKTNTNNRVKFLKQTKIQSVLSNVLDISYFLSLCSICLIKIDFNNIVYVKNLLKLINNNLYFINILFIKYLNQYYTLEELQEVLKSNLNFNICLIFYKLKNPFLNLR